MVQINQATSQLIAVTGGEASMFYGNGWMFGVAMAVIVAAIILGASRASPSDGQSGPLDGGHLHTWGVGGDFWKPV